MNVFAFTTMAVLAAGSATRRFNRSTVSVEVKAGGSCTRFAGPLYRHSKSRCAPYVTRNLRRLPEMTRVGFPELTQPSVAELEGQVTPPRAAHLQEPSSKQVAML